MQYAAMHYSCSAARQAQETRVDLHYLLLASALSVLHMHTHMHPACVCSGPATRLASSTPVLGSCSIACIECTVTHPLLSPPCAADNRYNDAHTN
jgi:hypothetical protein